VNPADQVVDLPAVRGRKRRHPQPLSHVLDAPPWSCDHSVSRSISAMRFARRRR
jgi:hypothetical protein